MTDRKLLRAAFCLSLVLHGVLAVLTWQIEFLPTWTPSARAAEPTVELLLVPDPASPADQPADQPRQYTEIPDRLAAERPDRADFLAMRDSRAADRLPGGQAGEQPGTERDAEFPQVAVDPENLAGAEGVTVEAPAFLPQSPSPRPAERPRQDAAPLPSAEASPHGEQAIADLADPEKPAAADRTRDGTQRADFEDWVAEQQVPSLLKEGRQQAPGDRGFDFRQLEQSRVGTNVNLDGDFSLNTYEWNFAPWMRRFASDLHRSWIAPYAYRLGIIDGYTRIRLVVERDGRPSGLDVLERQGHESLHTASVAALQAFAPYAPLPPDFPEDHLVILLGLHYPAWKR
ncbi:MAG: hypothetical protein PHQ53_05140 [Candidatus Krumholzibacteria bacterium]|nr:hypothetical protein [Candidatus Krumholzibacteria bacterium]